MSDELKKLYQQQLVRVGISSSRAQQAAQNLTLEQLIIVGQIWSDWSDTLVLQKSSVEPQPEQTVT